MELLFQGGLQPAELARFLVTSDFAENYHFLMHSVSGSTKILKEPFNLNHPLKKLAAYLSIPN